VLAVDSIPTKRPPRREPSRPPRRAAAAAGRGRVIVGYIQDRPNLISMAVNGWGAPEPVWWLNLQGHPEAVVELGSGIRRDVLGRAAVGAEREQLWQRFCELDQNPGQLHRATRARDGGRYPRAANGDQMTFGARHRSVCQRTADRECMPERPLSSTSVGSVNGNSPQRSVSSRTSRETRISPPRASAAMRAARTTAFP
jgi:hypothetical protein